MPQTDSKSSPGQEQPQNVQMATHPLSYTHQFEDDTIDLYELWITLWKRKWLVVALTVVAALGSIVYALQLQPVYNAKALILPPKTKAIYSLNIPRIPREIKEFTKLNSAEYSAEKVFKIFKQNLISRTVQKKFIQENGLMELLAPGKATETRDEDIYNGFAELIKLGEETDANGRQIFTSISIELNDPEIAAQWVNEIIEFVDKETIAMVLDDLQNSIANQIKNIEYTISSKRQMAEQRRDDQIREIETKIEAKRKIAVIRRKDKIKRYEEASQTAKNLGIMTGLAQQMKIVETSRGIIQQPLKSGEKSAGVPIAQMNVDVATATTPLFFMGYDALVSELAILKSRTNDDPFILGLRDLQEQRATFQSNPPEESFIEGLRDMQEGLALLRTIKFDNEKMSAVYIDQAAYPTKGTIRPSRRLFVSLATLVGLFSGVVLVFVIEFVQKQRKKHLE